MNTMKTLTGGAIALLIASCGKFNGAETVTDLGFEVETAVNFSSDYLCNTLSVGLKNGTEGEYLLNYVIDTDHTQKLTTLRGGEIESGDKIDLSLKNPLLMLLPKLAGDSHSLFMEFCRDGVSRRDTVTFRTENAVAVRMDTSEDLDFSRIVLKNRMGAAQTTYEVSFLLDGESISGIKYLGNEFGGSMELDFARSESFTFELPYILAGEHTLKVNIRSELGSESTTVTFSEPERKPTTLVMAYNDITGQLTLRSDYNPLPTEFEVTIDMTVTGHITYRHELFFGVADPKTEYFTESGQSKIRVTPGTSAISIDGGALRGLLDKIYSITRTDASNAIGNGNKRSLHCDIGTVTLKFTIASLGAIAGKTSVQILPSYSGAFPIRYLYKSVTWSHSANQTQTIIPTYTVNGKSPSLIHTL